MFAAIKLCSFPMSKYRLTGVFSIIEHLELKQHVAFSVNAFSIICNIIYNLKIIFNIIEHQKSKLALLFRILILIENPQSAIYNI